MKSSAIFWSILTITGLVSGNPAQQAACNADNCARAVSGGGLRTSSRSLRLADCSSFLSFTVVPFIPTVTSTVTPTATATVIGATVTNFLTIVSETAWPTTINSEVFGRDAGGKRVADRCRIASTISPTLLPAYATTACDSSAARFSSACRCAGVIPKTTTLACSTSRATVTAPPIRTITETATLTENDVKFVTQLQSTALIDPIRCGQIIPIDEDLPAYKIVCEAEGTGNRTLIGTVNNTDWDNCVERATFGFSADDWEFDIAKNICYIYDPFSSDRGANRNVTRPRSRYVYAYIYGGS